MQLNFNQFQRKSNLACAFFLNEQNLGSKYIYSITDDDINADTVV